MIYNICILETTHPFKFDNFKLIKNNEESNEGAHVYEKRSENSSSITI